MSKTYVAKQIKVPTAAREQVHKTEIRLKEDLTDSLASMGLAHHQDEFVIALAMVEPYMRLASVSRDMHGREDSGGRLDMMDFMSIMNGIAISYMLGAGEWDGTDYKPGALPIGVLLDSKAIKLRTGKTMTPDEFILTVGKISDMTTTAYDEIYPTKRAFKVGKKKYVGQLDIEALFVTLFSLLVTLKESKKFEDD